VNSANLPIDVLMKWGSVAMIGVALFIATVSLVGDRDGPGQKYWFRYTSMIERNLRTMFIWTPGRVVATAQLGILAAVFAVEFVIPDGLPAFPLWPVAVAIGPYVWIESEKAKRKAAIEFQLDGFMLALANALKAIPSISAALNSVVPILQPPMREEVELATKEMKVGSTLDQALLHMAARIGSRSVDSALSAVLIGRQVGGNLGKVLETTALSLREMQRLEGVVRTKTAEGKMQLWVIGGLPVGIIVVMSLLQPGFFDPLQSSLFGYLLSGAAAGFWIAALVMARKILAVDI
jgi:tight adherence protein B